MLRTVYVIHGYKHYFGKNSDKNSGEGFVAYPRFEYELRPFRDATIFETRKEAEHLRDWYYRRSGIFDLIQVKKLEVEEDG